MKVFVCLLGNWTDITKSGTIFQKDPITFIKEELGNYDKENNFKSFAFDYVNIEYDGNLYRIHPSMIQIVK